jgi:putative OPT family oligopeptide transporter
MRKELTLRGLLLGAAITLVFTAANVYLGLKVGLTFASSIPAAVISMAVLRAVKNATIYENNIVQTVASAAGTLSSVIFVLPGLVMVGWWHGGRHPRRHVQRAAATCARHEVGPAIS